MKLIFIISNQLDLSQAAWFYATNNNYNYVEFPENGLPPSHQVEWLENKLAEVNQTGELTVVATYSPYIIDHLVNIMKMAKYPANLEENAKLLFTQNPQAIISGKEVGVWEFKGTSLHSVKDDEDFVDWGVFGRTSDRVSEIFFKINEDEESAYLPKHWKEVE